MTTQYADSTNILEHDDEIYAVSPFHGLQMSLEDFLTWEPEADGWKYEWENGIIIGEEESMRKKQIALQVRILDAFSQTVAYQAGSRLIAEVDCELSEGLLRRPDIAYFTAAQIAEMEEGNAVIPAFVIEVISPGDNFNRLEQKLFDYFRVGVQCVWYVNPQLGVVRAYSSPEYGAVCRDEQICSAAPAITDFQMTARQIFAK
jgi:Uma2 family endonuclease